MIYVCPNCHAQLDFAAIPIDEKILNNKDSHKIDAIYVKYHNEERYME